MSNKTQKKKQDLEKWRRNIGHQFASKLGLSSVADIIGENKADRLYNLHNLIAGLITTIEKLNPNTWTKLIIATPRRSDTSTSLLEPRDSEMGLQSLNCLNLSGHDYLVTLAGCALTSAVYDYLAKKKT